MPSRIEDYAVIGNCETVALVGRDGSIDWLGLPRFDSAACFAALLGEARHGRWIIAANDSAASVSRRYLGDTLILETSFETDDGAASIIDFLTRRDGTSDLVRLVRGRRGRSRCARNWSSGLTTARSFRGPVVAKTAGENSPLDPTDLYSTRRSIFMARIGEQSANSPSPREKKSPSR